MAVIVSEAQSGSARVDPFYRTRLGQLRATGIIRLALSPLISAIVNPLSLVQTLLNCRVLLQGRWSSYTGFSSAPAFLKLFYSVQANNLQRHGLHGTSNTIGTGKYRMKAFWYQSMLGITMQDRLGSVVTVLAGMSIWVVSHSVWLAGSPSPLLGLLTVFLAASTTNFFGNTFDRQNYNALGWAVFPIIIWSTLQHQIWILAVTLLVASFLSITVTLMGAVVVLVVAVLEVNFLLPAVIVLPAMKFLVDLMAGEIAGGKDLLASVKRLLATIGAHPSAKYRRPVRVGYVAVLALVLSAFPVAVYLTGATTQTLSPLELSGLALLPVVWLVVNQTRLIRLADVQSVMMLFLSVSAAIVLAAPSIVLVAVFWVVNSNPLIAMLLFEFDLPWPKMLAHAPAVRPFDIQPYLDDIDDFLKPVASGERLWLAFSDPGNDYNQLFDGLSTVYQALSYRADARLIHALPDWYCVMEHNYEGAQDIWGREPNSVSSHMAAWNARYALIYRRGAEYSEDYWTSNGFSVIGRMSWDRLARSVPHSPVLPPDRLEWWLIEARGNRGV